MTVVVREPSALRCWNCVAGNGYGPDGRTGPPLGPRIEQKPGSEIEPDSELAATSVLREVQLTISDAGTRRV